MEDLDLHPCMFESFFQPQSLLSRMAVLTGLIGFNLQNHTILLILN